MTITATCSFVWQTALKSDATIQFEYCVERHSTLSRVVLILFYIVFSGFSLSVVHSGLFEKCIFRI